MLGDPFAAAQQAKGALIDGADILAAMGQVLRAACGPQARESSVSMEKMTVMGARY